MLPGRAWRARLRVVRIVGVVAGVVALVVAFPLFMRAGPGPALAVPGVWVLFAVIWAAAERATKTYRATWDGKALRLQGFRRTWDVPKLQVQGIEVRGWGDTRWLRAKRRSAATISISADLFDVQDLDHFIAAVNRDVLPQAPEPVAPPVLGKARDVAWSVFIAALGIGTIWLGYSVWRGDSAFGIEIELAPWVGIVIAALGLVTALLGLWLFRLIVQDDAGPAP